MTMDNTATLKQYGFTSVRTYVAAAIFIAGNIIVPQLCHLIPGGGLIFLPIYFFTLICAFKCGWKAGLLTAILSPLVNCLLFGMPPVASLPGIMIKSVALVLAVAIVSRKIKFSIWAVAIAVLAYQLVGMTAEFFMDFNLLHAIQDVRIGWPGILIQIVGGYFLLRAIEKW